LALATGRIASTLEIKARWIYSELVSSRLGEMHRAYPPLAEVSQLALAGVPFDDVPEAHHQALADAAALSHPMYMTLVNQHEKYVLTGWGKQQLAAAYVDKFFNTPRRNVPLRFRDFLIWSRNTGEGGTPNPMDPRVAADAIPPGTPPMTDAAPIVVGVGGNMIVDGYLRCTLFMRDAPANATLPVWVGVSR
jgi:hypothetical protein